MKYLWILVLITFLACSSDKKQADTSAKSITLIFKSADAEQLMVFPALTPKEEESYTSHYVVEPNDTLTVPLNEDLQLIDFSYQIPWDFNLIVSSGDTIVAELDAKQKNVYRLTNGKKETIRTAEEEAFGNSIDKEALEALMLKSLADKDTKPAESLSAYVKANEAYYGKQRDSLLKTGNPKAKILADVVLAEQYEKLWDMNASFKDAGLTKQLVSDKYINLDNFNNRNLWNLFNVYGYNYIIANPLNKTLTERYKTDFKAYPKEIEADFKLRAIIQMIVQKYDRDTVIQYIDDYKAAYGSNKNLEDWMKRIGYGVQSTDDLSLIDANNHKETFETLKKKHKGKVIYVDFWASWCGPCLAEMPYSDKLKKEQKDVVFVYLALSDEEEPWKTAMEKYNVKENSYFITNTESSTFLSKHKITSIPRYMVVDKKGEIINTDAPRPSSTEIKDLLKAELKR